MTDRSRAWRALMLCLAAISLVFAAAAHAQTYPDRRIIMVVPYTAGSGFDFIGRTIGHKISERWGQPAIIDNKPGASGTIGAEAVAYAAPDGYTILVTGMPHGISPVLFKNMRYDPVASFTPLGTVGLSGLALVVNPNVFPVSTAREFLAEIRARPGQLNHSSPGVGTLQHFGMELIKQQLGLNAVHVPYRGAASALTDLLSGQVQFTLLPVHNARPHAQAGKLRILAVASPRRSPFAPDIPTFAEAGLPDVDFDLWYGLLGPANLPAAIAQKWEKELAAIVELPDVKEMFKRQGMAPDFRDAKTTGELIKAEIARWREVAEKAGLKPE